jgi:hypothetical protein
MTLMILEDRYCGAYSGGKWLVIENYYETLQPEELYWLNNHIKNTDKFYEARNEKWQEQAIKADIYFKPELPRDNRLTTISTRYEAVERTLQASDCYAVWNYDLMPWCKAVNDLSEILLKSYQNKTDYWHIVYRPEE